MPPQRVVSINLCSDVYALAFANRRQIVSLSYLATHSPLSAIHDQALGIPTNHGRIGEVLALHPDLVLTYQFADPHIARWLKGQGVNVVTISAPLTIRQMRKQWQKIARLLGHPQHARALDKRLSRVLQHAPAPGSKGTIAVFGPNGTGILPGSLLPALLEASGYQLLHGLDKGAASHIDIESLLVHPPDTLLLVRDTKAVNTLAAEKTHNPALASLHSRTLVLPSRLWDCAGPAVLRALQKLQASS